MAFKDHGEAILRGLPAKKLPYRGTWYEFPRSLSARTGLYLSRIANRSRDAAEAGATSTDDVDLDEDMFADLGDVERRDIEAEILGDALPRLLADDVPAAVVDHMVSTLVVWHVTGRQDAAEQAWNDVSGPKAPQDRKPKSSGSTGKRSTRSAKRTQSRASTAPTSQSEGSDEDPGGPTS